MHEGRVFCDQITSSAAHRLLGQSDRRVRLTLYPPSSGVAYVLTDVGVSSTNGIYFPAGSTPLYFDVDFHGNCVQCEWYIIYTGGGSGVAWIETICNKEHGEDAHHQPAKRKQGGY